MTCNNSKIAFCTTVQGIVADVLKTIYEAYQQLDSDAFSKNAALENRTSTEEEIQLAHKEGNGSNGPKLIDQMDNLIEFGGWDYYEHTHLRLKSQ